MRDTTKKLIYAIEQQQIASSNAEKAMLAIKPPTHKATTKDGIMSLGSTRSGGTYQSVAD